MFFGHQSTYVYHLSCRLAAIRLFRDWDFQIVGFDKRSNIIIK